jgi:Primase C terminal 2 (PriCT-2)/RepB DNA-primase from phage plasmid
MTQDDLSTFLRVIPPHNRTWQTFDDKRFDNGQPRRSRCLSRILIGSLANVEPVLRRLNAPNVGAGVYISGNVTDGFGRSTNNITRIAAVIADMDNGLPSSFPLVPTIVVETSPGKFQSWWVLDDGETLTVTEHRHLHTRLVHEYGADPRATGIARVYRVPGFWHLKGEPFLVRVVGGAMRPVSQAALVTAFPPISQQERMMWPPPAPAFASAHRAPGLDRLAAPLQAIPADDYATWIAVGLALHAESGGGSDGLALWDAWSDSSAKYWPGDCASRWASFKTPAGNLATGGKIFWLAARHGWRRSASSGSCHQYDVRKRNYHATSELARAMPPCCRAVSGATWLVYLDRRLTRKARPPP